MTLWAIFRFEVGYQSRRISTWFYAALLLLVTLYVSAEVSTEYARSSGTFSNDPYFAALMAVLGSLIGLLIAAAVSGDAAARDVQTRMNPFVYTTPVGRFAYLMGRCLAGFSLYAASLCAVPIALVLVSLLTNRALVGPFHPAAYLNAYLFLLLPNAFVATALLFAMAVLSRQAVVSYVGALLIVGLTAFSYVFLALTLQQWELAKLLDPSGALPSRSSAACGRLLKRACG